MNQEPNGPKPEVTPEVHILEAVNIDPAEAAIPGVANAVDAEPQTIVLVTTSAVDLTEEERAWCIANGRDAANALLVRWYRHARNCRRTARKHGQGPLMEKAPFPCLCR
jgi:hypothetical protein